MSYKEDTLFLCLKFRKQDVSTTSHTAFLQTSIIFIIHVINLLLVIGIYFTYISTVSTATATDIQTPFHI
jgi:hypothetical protein